MSKAPAIRQKAAIPYVDFPRIYAIRRRSTTHRTLTTRANAAASSCPEQLEGIQSSAIIQQPNALAEKSDKVVHGES